ncbi:HAD hydrolase family protein [Listeria seeligeri]|uniref:HAD hydrolase family protein n=1 Tax=Listeria seeligeri TaxID=1640 RepID=UPI0001C4E31C|nr:HAD family hydrolase [Listeria seeligeri]MBC1722336.1 HAD family phosphatase [Listeria seeligeri]MBF2435863.1 HAD family phosphatase [Listeria seeligeri]CBH27286.1 hypothetical protein lse_1135 [Listeria seeligeri serovar 1/2b str. SLCC3954]
MFEGIVLDIDDTLIKDDGNISIEDSQYIFNLKQKGYQIILATGRNLDETLNIAEKLDITTPIILLQGSLIYYGLDESYQTALSMKSISDVTKWCQDNRVNFRIVTKDGNYLIDSYKKLNNGFNREKILHINVYFENNDEKKIFENFFEDRVDMMVRVHSDSAICMSICIDKGLALRRVATELGWDLGKFISIGNYPSDGNMFDETGYNIVIENKKELNKIKDVQLISNASVSIALEELLSKVAAYQKVKYRKNLNFRIRNFGGTYYSIGEKEINKVSRLIFDLWRSIVDDVYITETLKSLTMYYNIFDVIEGLEYLINKTIIERR